MKPINEVLALYDSNHALPEAWTIPAPWYTDKRISDAESREVFGKTWQFIGRVDQLIRPGDYIAARIANEPVVVVRQPDQSLRGFFNVCRHHAAEIATQPQGNCGVLRCPYHGWTYELNGCLKGAPEFEEVRNFNKADNGLVPVHVETWENFVFVRLSESGPSLREFLGEMADRIIPLNIKSLKFFERRSYTLNCNWKVYVDNFLDGGYHVPHIHKGLTSVLEYQDYMIENGPRYCLQYSPMKSGRDAETASVRKGDMAYYYWLYPNFMLNWYEGVMDINLVIPMGVDRCEVIFDFYFDDVGTTAEARNRQSVCVGERVQQEDINICESVQRGLTSRAYVAGRLSVRREAGEHLFHRLLAADLRRCTSD